MIQLNVATVRTELSAIKAMISQLEKLLDEAIATAEGAGEEVQVARFLPKEATSLSHAIMIMIEDAPAGLTSAELVKAIQPFSRSPYMLVRQFIRRQGTAGRIKRMDGRWYSADVPGKADVIPQQRHRISKKQQTH